MLKESVEPRKERTTLASEWFTGLSEDEKKSFKELLLNSNVQFEPLKRILQTRFDGSLEKEADVTKNGWERQVLHGQGYRQALKDIYKLLP